MDATTINLEQMGRVAKTAAMTLGQLTTLQKNTSLLAMAANKADLAAASALPAWQLGLPHWIIRLRKRTGRG